MTAYYNEIDPFAAAWLRELIKAGHIAPGDVDTRSIVDVRPDDLRKYTQCHFFAGIGVWSYSLRRAGWPDNRPIWTGSCPCPPFSSAGKGQTCPACGSKRNLCHPVKTGHFICLDCGCDRFADARHLWPEFSRLIKVCRPAVVLGEQVASEDGRRWLDAVSADLQLASYGFAGADLCAAGVGAPHIRQRLYWMADAASSGQPRGRGTDRCDGAETIHDSGLGRLGDDDDARLEGQRRGYQAESGREGTFRPIATTGQSGGLADDDDDDRREAGLRRGSVRAERDVEHGDSLVGLADAHSFGAQCKSGDAPETAGLPQGERQPEYDPYVPERSGPNHDRREDLCGYGVSGDGTGPGPTNGLWRAADWLFCRDGKWRPVEPGTFPLAHGATARVGRLRGYGNAINAEQAQGFIEACIETLDGHFRLTETYHSAADTKIQDVFG